MKKFVVYITLLLVTVLLWSSILFVIPELHIEGLIGFACFVGLILVVALIAMAFNITNDE